MSVLTDRLHRIGGRVEEHELLLQLSRKDNLNLSLNELQVHMRQLELSGEVEVHTSYKAVEL